eukprot:XP_025005003.1 uncharacterized protein LOC112532132 [Gallus gallus]
MSSRERTPRRCASHRQEEEAHGGGFPMPFASFSDTFASERSSPSDKGQMFFSGNFSLKSDRRLKLSASEKHLSSLTSPIHRSTVFLLTATQCSLRHARPKQKAAVFQAQALTPTTLHVKKCVSEGAGGSTQAADGTPSSARPLPPQHHHLAARSAGANSAQRRRLRLSLRVSRSCPRGRRPPALSALCCLGVCPSIRPSVRPSVCARRGRAARAGCCHLGAGAWSGGGRRGGTSILQAEAPFVSAGSVPAFRHRYQRSTCRSVYLLLLVGFFLFFFFFFGLVIFFSFFFFLLRRSF